jgi:hypothetical protein
MSKSASELFIVDNSDSDWKVRSYLSEWCGLSRAIDIATGYFEVTTYPVQSDVSTIKIKDL